MTRRVGDDEAPRRGGKEAVGDVDGDALLSLGLQAIDQERKVEARPLRAELARISFQGSRLVFEDRARIVQQPPNQRRLAIVDAAAGDEAKQGQAQK
jgi:hypothetical protein